MTSTLHKQFCLAAAITGLLAAQPIVLHAQYQSLGGILVDSPSCANSNDGTGQVICAAVGTSNALVGIRFRWVSA
jgi:hypothetical protein